MAVSEETEGKDKTETKESRSENKGGNRVMREQ